MSNYDPNAAAPRRGRPQFVDEARPLPLAPIWSWPGRQCARWRIPSHLCSRCRSKARLVWPGAAVLAAVEALAPGMFFIWFGLAAGLTGLVVLVVPGLSWQWEAGLFVVLAVVSVFLGRSFVHRNPKESADPSLNDHNPPLGV